MFDKLSKTFGDTLDSISGKTTPDGVKITKREDQIKAAYLEDQQVQPGVAAIGGLQRTASQVLKQLDDGYFTQSFDPVSYELQQLDNDANQEQIDATVEKLASALEVVSRKLKRHVVQNQKMLIEGINNVALVEDDLKAAFLVTKSIRSALKFSAENVQRFIRVTEQTKRKQGYMEMLDVCTKLQKAKDLQKSLKAAQEEEHYGEAILLCVECFQGVESLGHLEVSQELAGTVQRLYYETLQRLDAALQQVCGEFDAEKYGKVLEGYMLQGATSQQLSEKVISCFKEQIHQQAMKVLRSVMLTKPRLVEVLSASSLEGSFAELCKSLPVDLLRPCLLRLMDVLFDIIQSYQLMSMWHEAGLKQAYLLEAKEKPEQASSEPRPDEAGPEAQSGTSPDHGGAVTEMEKVMKEYLQSVCTALDACKSEVWEFAGRKVRELLASPRYFKGEDFLQVVEWGLKFVGVGETFVGSMTDLRSEVVAVCSKFFESYHRSNLESLSICIQTEHWKDIGSVQGSIFPGMLAPCANQSPYYIPCPGEDGAKISIAEWAYAGNPFKQAADESSSKQKRKKGQTGSNKEQEAGKTGREVLQVARAEPLSTPEATSPTKSPGPMVTVSSQHILKWLTHYLHLMKPLEPRAVFLFRSICELFDAYFLATFLTFSCVSLEQLVWRDDVVTTRLQATLMKMLTVTGSKYKAQVEDLQRQKPAKVAAMKELNNSIIESINNTGKSGVDRFNASLDSFAIKLSQGFDNVEARLMKAMGENKVPSPGGPASSMSGGPVPAAEPGSPRRPYDALSTSSIVTSGNLYGLRERGVAIESLVFLASELKSARPALLALLPSNMAKDVENYYLRTVDATQDLKDCVFRGGTRLLLQDMLNSERGVAVQISQTNYAGREPATAYNPWVQEMCKHYQTFADIVTSTSLPAPIRAQMWEHAIKGGAECILEGFSRVRRCTLEGRASMSLDVSGLEKALRQMQVPVQASSGLRIVDTYIKAFYLPWEELAHWAQQHVGEVGKVKVLLLVECIADAYRIKRSQKEALVSKLHVDLAEFA